MQRFPTFGATWENLFPFGNGRGEGADDRYSDRIVDTVRDLTDLEAVLFSRNEDTDCIRETIVDSLVIDETITRNGRNV